MDILGIGPLELVFILLIALIVLGPNDMVKAGRTLGRFLRKLVTSPGWQMVQQTSKDLRYLPNKLMREAGLEELKEKIPTQSQISKEIGLDDLKQEMRDTDREVSKGLSAWTTPGKTIKTPEKPPEIPPATSESPAKSQAPETPPAQQPPATASEPEAAGAAPAAEKPPESNAGGENPEQNSIPLKDETGS